MLIDSSTVDDKLLVSIARTLAIPELDSLDVDLQIIGTMLVPAHVGGVLRALEVDCSTRKRNIIEVCASLSAAEKQYLFAAVVRAGMTRIPNTLMPFLRQLPIVETHFTEDAAHESKTTSVAPIASKKKELEGDRMTDAQLGKRFVHAATPHLKIAPEGALEALLDGSYARCTVQTPTSAPQEVTQDKIVAVLVRLGLRSVSKTQFVTEQVLDRLAMVDPATRDACMLQVLVDLPTWRKQAPDFAAQLKTYAFVPTMDDTALRCPAQLFDPRCEVDRLLVDHGQSYPRPDYCQNALALQVHRSLILIFDFFTVKHRVI